MSTVGPDPFAALNKLGETANRIADERNAFRAALVEIRDHWALQYDHPRKQSEMYQGSYGIGVTDGHRACAIIARKALGEAEDSASKPNTVVE